MPYAATLRRPLRTRQRGVSLIELVIAIVVISVGVVGVLQAVHRAMRDSADPMIEKQSLAIAEAYMEEIMLQAYAHTATAEARDNSSCPSSGGVTPTYDDVLDYAGLHDVGARDQWGCAITDLASYTVDVAVQNATLNGTAALKIDVAVTHAPDYSYTLTGYRVNTP